MTDFPDRFADLEEIYVGDRRGWELRKIEAARVISGRPAIKFIGVDNKEEAARLTNRELAVSTDRLVKLPEDTFYVFDLVGCELVDHESGRKLGELTEVRQYPANDIYVVKAVDGQEVLFPAVADLVIEVDTASKRIRVREAGLFGEADEKKE